MITKCGFRTDVKSANHLLWILRRKRAHVIPVPTHYNLEKGTAKLHSAMYALEKSGYIDIHREDRFDNDVLFSLSITIRGMECIRNTINTVASVIAAIFSVMAFIAGLYY